MKHHPKWRTVYGLRAYQWVIIYIGLGLTGVGSVLSGIESEPQVGVRLMNVGFTIQIMAFWSDSLVERIRDWIAKRREWGLYHE